MRAIRFDQAGGPEVLYMGTWEKPIPGPGELLVKVAATALNRADTLQRQGKYPPPPGASPILGLEMAGEIVGWGEEQSSGPWKQGDRVMALLPGGGYAEYVTLPAAMAMPVPSNLSFKEAAALPEVFLTAYQALVWLADLSAGERLLIHAGASGVGTAAIQIAREIGAEIWVTASARKHEACLELGAHRAIDYHHENFEEVIRTETKGEGVHVILDFLAAPYFQPNLNSLALEGRLVMLGLMGGIKAQQVNLAPILFKRLNILGTTLRSRSPGYKQDLTKAFCDFALSRFASGQLKPVIDSHFSWEKVGDAHAYMEANQNIGKIVLTLD